MDRKLARKNIRSGLIAGAVCLFMFGMTFVAAAIYLTDVRPKVRGINGGGGGTSSGPYGPW